MNNNRVTTAIHGICKKIDDNIVTLVDTNVHLLSQNIIADLRHLTEHVALKIYSNGADLYPTYDYLKEGVRHVKSIGKYKWLAQFHCWTENSVSHYCPDREAAYRLMHKYYVSIIQIKDFLATEYQLEVLQNLDRFPIRQDSDSQQYYEKIAGAIKEHPAEMREHPYKDRSYILSNQSIIINRKVYYQITFTTAHSNVSKFDRSIAFSNIEIPSNYAVKFKMDIREIEVHENIKIPVNIITDYETSIRPCEIDNFSKIFDKDTKGKGEANACN